MLVNVDSWQSEYFTNWRCAGIFISTQSSLGFTVNSPKKRKNVPWWRKMACCWSFSDTIWIKYIIVSTFRGRTRTPIYFKPILKCITLSSSLFAKVKTAVIIFLLPVSIRSILDSTFFLHHWKTQQREMHFQTVVVLNVAVPFGNHTHWNESKVKRRPDSCMRWISISISEGWWWPMVLEDSDEVWRQVEGLCVILYEAPVLEFTCSYCVDSWNSEHV